MAKKTLNDLKRCPIDFLYLWASDSFISQLGNKAKIIKQKKYNQYQTLWKTMAQNESFKSTEDGLVIYKRWVDELEIAIKDVYGITPVEILDQLALGKTVFGKNFQKGLYGIGNTESKSESSIVFRSNDNIFVDPSTGKIKDKSGTEIKRQTAIYDASGNVSGYSAIKNGVQYQSILGNAGYVAYTYSNVNEIRRANGELFSADQGSFWQNANNYMPIIEQIMEWITTIINSTFGNATLLTSANTLPAQTEWIEEDNSNLLLGLAVVAGVAILATGDDKKKKKNNSESMKS